MSTKMTPRRKEVLSMYLNKKVHWVAGADVPMLKRLHKERIVEMNFGYTGTEPNVIVSDYKEDLMYGFHSALFDHKDRFPSARIFLFTDRMQDFTEVIEKAVTQYADHYGIKKNQVGLLNEYYASINPVPVKDFKPENECVIQYRDINLVDKEK
jgi:hypothetical protein